MIEQGSDEWKALRCGKATASRFADIMAKIKTGEAASRKDYRAQLVCERLTGKPVESFTNRAMQVGVEREPDARALYEAMTRKLVDEAAFVQIVGMEAGASPDGLVGERGLLEIKCPNAATHIEYLRLGDGKCPKAYWWQIQGQLWATGRDWCDFVSYHPDFPDELKIAIRRVERDEDAISELLAEVTLFLSEVTAEVEELRALMKAA